VQTTVKSVFCNLLSVTCYTVVLEKSIVLLTHISRLSMTCNGHAIQSDRSGQRAQFPHHSVAR